MSKESSWNELIGAQVLTINVWGLPADPSWPDIICRLPLKLTGLCSLLPVWANQVEETFKLVAPHPFRSEIKASRHAFDQKMLFVVTNSDFLASVWACPLYVEMFQLELSKAHQTLSVIDVATGSFALTLIDRSFYLLIAEFVYPGALFCLSFLWFTNQRILGLFGYSSFPILVFLRHS